MAFDTPVGCKCDKCKRCKNRIKAENWRKKNKEKTAAYYEENKDRILACSRDWKETNREKVNEYQKEYRQRPDARELRNAADRKRRHDKDRYLKIQAREKVRGAIRRGRLERKDCEVCGTNENVHAHHEDYSKPFDIVWLCATHHREVHKKNKLASTDS